MMVHRAAQNVTGRQEAVLRYHPHQQPTRPEKNEDELDEDHTDAAANEDETPVPRGADHRGYSMLHQHHWRCFCCCVQDEDHPPDEDEKETLVLRIGRLNDTSLRGRRMGQPWYRLSSSQQHLRWVLLTAHSLTRRRCRILARHRRVRIGIVFDQSCRRCRCHHRCLSVRLGRCRFLDTDVRGMKSWASHLPVLSSLTECRPPFPSETRCHQLVSRRRQRTRTRGEHRNRILDEGIDYHAFPDHVVLAADDLVKTELHRAIAASSVWRVGGGSRRCFWRFLGWHASPP
mmetsp:Transcript_24824/g.69709  ORF Transcript_24824/g.69709 Transcript_24824/m.69709 type:complete len:288 (+) Transcript_24824:729-1592(+)